MSSGGLGYKSRWNRIDNLWNHWNWSYLVPTLQNWTYIGKLLNWGLVVWNWCWAKKQGEAETIPDHIFGHCKDWWALMRYTSPKVTATVVTNMLSSPAPPWMFDLSRFQNVHTSKKWIKITCRKNCITPVFLKKRDTNILTCTNLWSYRLETSPLISGIPTVQVVHDLVLVAPQEVSTLGAWKPTAREQHRRTSYTKAWGVHMHACQKKTIGIYLYGKYI